MPMLSRPAFGPRTALAYVTIGLLMCVWTIVWYYTRDRELARSEWFWLSGLFFTGVTFAFLGMVLGRLGRAARQAELPPEEAIRAEAGIQQTAASHPPAVAMAPGGAGMATMPPAQMPAAPAPVAPVAPAAPAAPIIPNPAVR